MEPTLDSYLYQNRRKMFFFNYKAARLYAVLFIVFSCSTKSVALATIGDQVWEDINANGVFDKYEPGINGVQVKLYADVDRNGIPDGSALASTQTSFSVTGNGYYYFPNLTPGYYLIQFVLPFSFYFSPQKVSSTNELLDSDPNPTTGFTNTIQVIGNEYNTQFDAGIFRKTTVGDYIWFDQNIDGIQNNDEQGLNGITVLLYNSAHALIDQTATQNHPTTQKSGYYQFNQVPPGKFYIKINLPNGKGYKASLANRTTEDKDNDIDHSNGDNTSALFDVIYNTPKTDVDGALYYAQSIGNKVWLDVDRDGIQDTNESGINQIQVYLYNKLTNVLVDTKLTSTNALGESGTFVFENLAISSYYIKLDVPTFYYVTKSNQTTEANDSDIDHMNGLNTSSTILLSEYESNKNQDIGLFKAFRLGNYVWNDIGQGASYMNGIQDSNEEAEPNVLVYLFDSNDMIIDSQYTDNTGKFEFLVDEGQYYLKFNTPNNKTFTFPNQSSESIDSDVTGTFGFGTTELLTILPNTNEMDIDAGLAPAGVLAIRNLNFWISDSEERILKWTLDNPEDVAKIHLEQKINSSFQTIYESTSDFAMHEYSIQKETYEIQYYRLTIYEKNGFVTKSKILLVNPQQKSNFYLAYFNMNKLFIETKKAVEGDLTVSVHSIDGATLLIKNIQNRQSSSVFELDANDIPQGSYLIRIQEGEKNNVIKIVK